VEELTILVKGSSADPYKLIFIKDGESLTALCDCPAGSFGNVCKHRVAILDGDADAVLEEDAAKVAKVVEWLAGTDVEKALADMRAAESDTEASKPARAAAKKTLARAMNS
jgi:uncharacterized Zn finger protein